MSCTASKKDFEPLVSVYCMTYNHADTIAQTIEGVLSQQADFAFELIVHDDASTDGTADIVRSYAERYPDKIVPILQSENQFHKCNILKTFILTAVRGRYVAVCEGDDYWTDCEKLKLQVEHMENDPACCLCFHAVQQLMPDGKMMNYRPLKSSGEVSAELIIKRGGLFCPTASLMFRRDVLDSWPEFRERADVYDYPAQVLAASEGKAYYIDRIMAVYRFASEGSWTAQRAEVIDYEHLGNEESWMELFNDYTQNRYADAINYHLAHLWFTEYRKTFESSVKKRAKIYIKKLKFFDKLMFTALFAVFSLLGRSGNKLWQIFKKIVLK
ncbi:MAG: glycosyltransferase [Oscillospiraceae bacterium]|nr:glycosyltransferase [Oscillospiraceae bacterium]